MIRSSEEQPYLMINTSNIEEAKRLLKKEQPLKIVLAQNDEFNRKISEQALFDIILSLEKGNRKNKIRQIDSGLNHVLSNIISKRKIAIGIDLEEIRCLEPKQKGERLAKIKQNIKISRKYRVNIAIKTKSLKNARDVLNALGSSTQQNTEAIVF